MVIGVGVVEEEIAAAVVGRHWIMIGLHFQVVGHGALPIGMVVVAVGNHHAAAAVRSTAQGREWTERNEIQRHIEIVVQVRTAERAFGCCCCCVCGGG